MVRRLDAAAAELPRWQSLMVESFSAMLVREVFLGRGAEARSRFVRVLGQLRDAGERWIRSHVCFMLAELEGLSDPGRELALTEEAIEASEGLELVHAQAALRARRAVLLARAGRSEEARREPPRTYLRPGPGAPSQARTPGPADRDSSGPAP